MPLRQIPLFWGRWLPHISAFQHGVDALIAGLWGNIDYTCEAELNTNNATCVFSGVTFDCDVAFNGTAGTCIVSGREVVAKYKGINPDKTDSLIYLLLIGLVCRALTYFFYLYPVKGILGSLKRWMRSQASKSIMEITSEQTRLRRVVDALQQEAGVSSASSASLALSGPTASAAARAASAPETTSKSSSSAPHGGRDLVFRNVWVYLSKKKAKKVLLHDISGCARAGRVCALMGTLLCCVAKVAAMSTDPLSSPHAAAAALSPFPRLLPPIPPQARVGLAKPRFSTPWRRVRPTRRWTARSFLVT